MSEATSTNGSVREFKMPDVGEGLTEAEILKWYVQPGDTVTDGQVVCEVETAKAAVELPIPFDGVVRELRFPEGTTVAVGQAIITVEVAGGVPAGDDAGASGDGASGGAGEGSSGGASGAGSGTTEGAGTRQPVLVGYGVAQSSSRRRPRKHAAGPARDVEAGSGSGGARGAGGPGEVREPAGAASSAPSEVNGHVGGPAAAAAPSPPAASGAVVAGGVPSRPLAKPPVRKLAKDLGVDLASVVPSGPDGVITREDVHAAAAAASEAASEAAGEAAGTGAAAGAVSEEPFAGGDESAAATAEGGAAWVGAQGRETRIPVRGVRKATAQAMVDSAFSAPHVTEFVTVDVTRTVRLVEQMKRDPDRYGLTGLRINPLLMVAKALLVAIKRNPEVNASWDEKRQEIVQKHYVNLGIAAATPRGLIVPNIKDAHAKTLPELAEALAELVSTARAGRTAPGAMQGGTVTITNVGVFGIDSGTPILNPGESAILAVGAIKAQPWVHKGKVKPRQVTTLALSFDHRLVDGELGSKVLADVAAILEEPKRLIAWG